MSNPNYTLTYDELLLLLKEAYRNGYANYEMTAAGLEPYDDDGYARWVLLGMESNKMKPTAVEWLVNELSKSKYYYKIIEYINAMGSVERDVIKQAKEMEREKWYAKEKADVSSSAEFKVWDDLFGILSWKFKPTKSGDMYLDGEAVYNELKEKFDLRRK